MPPKPVFSIKFPTAKAGKVIGELRAQMGLSIRGLSAASGVSPSHIAGIERGGDFTVGKLMAIAAGCGCHPWYIVDRSHGVLRFDQTVLREQLKADEVADVIAADPDRFSSALIAIESAYDWAVSLLFSLSPEADIRVARFSPEYGPGLGAFGEMCESASHRKRSLIFRRLRYEGMPVLRELKLVTSEMLISPHVALAAQTFVKFRFTASDAGSNSPPVMTSAPNWENLRRRLSCLLEFRGAQAKLAKTLKLTRQAVSQWVRGKNTPDAEFTLRVLQWVTAREAEKKDSARAETRTEQVTRSTKPKPHEKRKPSRKRP